MNTDSRMQTTFMPFIKLQNPAPSTQQLNKEQIKQYVDAQITKRENEKAVSSMIMTSCSIAGTIIGILTIPAAYMTHYYDIYKQAEQAFASIQVPDKSKLLQEAKADSKKIDFNLARKGKIIDKFNNDKKLKLFYKELKGHIKALETTTRNSANIINNAISTRKLENLGECLFNHIDISANIKNTLLKIQTKQFNKLVDLGIAKKEPFTKLEKMLEKANLKLWLLPLINVYKYTLAGIGTALLINIYRDLQRNKKD